MLAKRYFERIDTILRKVVEEQAERLSKAAEMIVDASISGGRFWVYDKGGAVASEVTGRAGGLLMVQPLTDPDASQLRGGDVVAISAVRNDDPSNALLVEGAKAKGAKAITILPFNNPPNAPERLQEMVDLAIDDYAELGDGCLEVQGYASKVCPTSGVTNAAIMWSVCAEVVDELRRRGREASIYKSIFRVGNAEWNGRMREEFLKKGY